MAHYLPKQLTLDDVLQMCRAFKARHDHWPNYLSTQEQFEQAGIFGVSGPNLDAIVRRGEHGLWGHAGIKPEMTHNPKSNKDFQFYNLAPVC